MGRVFLGNNQTGKIMLNGVEYMSGGSGGEGQTIVTPALITDVSNFTKVYSTSGDVNYGSLGSRVSSALDITDANILTSYMANGWNDSHACFYDSEDKIGAYAGYNFGEELNIDKVDFWLGRYSGQNKSLYATVQYLDSSNNWHDFIDLNVSSTISYPINVFSVNINRKCYGIRWIHKKGENKTSGNNLVFFGMLLYEYVGYFGLDSVTPLIPKMTSNTTPSGTASASSEYNSSYYAYKAFDQDYSSLWGSVDGVSTGQWIKYDFGESTRIVAFQVLNRSQQNYAVGSLTFQVSDDDSNWRNVVMVDNLEIGEFKFVILDKPVLCRAVRWYINSNAYGTSGTGFVELQVYDGTGGGSAENIVKGSFISGSAQYEKTEIDCGFQPDFVQVNMEFESSMTVATYSNKDNGYPLNVWDLSPTENRMYDITLGQETGETGISDITSTGFKYRVNAANTRNKACSYVAVKF